MKADVVEATEPRVRRVAKRVLVSILMSVGFELKGG